MELLERYVQAVGRYLPQRRKADILAELSANLREEMEVHAEVLGHPLNEEEQAEVLRRHEHPVAAAARYSDAPPLIGPELAPFYWFTLRRAAPIVATAVVLSRAVVLVYAPGVSHGVGPQITAVFSALLFYWGWVTAFFAALDWWRRRSPETFASKWEPRKLPKLRQEPRDHGPAHPGMDIILSVLFWAWLLAFPRYPVLLLGPAMQAMHGLSRGLSLDLAPVWHTFYWLVVGLNGLQIVFKLIALRPVSVTVRRGMDLAVHVWSLGMLLVLLRAPEYLVPNQATSAATHVGGLAIWNGNIHRALVIVAAIAAIKLVWSIVRMFSHREPYGNAHTALL